MAGKSLLSEATPDLRCSHSSAGRIHFYVTKHVKYFSVSTNLILGAAAARILLVYWKQMHIYSVFTHECRAWKISKNSALLCHVISTPEHMYTTPVWHSMKIEISEMTVKYSARIRLKPTSTMATYRPDQSIRNNVSPLYFDEITFIARVHRRPQCHRYTQRRTWWIAPLGSIQSRRRRRTEPKKWFMAQCTSDLSPCVWNACVFPFKSQ